MPNDACAALKCDPAPRAHDLRSAAYRQLTRARAWLCVRRIVALKDPALAAQVELLIAQLPHQQAL